jgi:hypothetical protein
MEGRRTFSLPPALGTERSRSVSVGLSRSAAPCSLLAAPLLPAPLRLCAFAPLRETNSYFQSAALKNLTNPLGNKQVK